MIRRSISVGHNENGAPRILLIYESGTRRGAWKGERVGELISALTAQNIRVFFLGLRGLLEFPRRRAPGLVCLCFASPGIISRFSGKFSLSPRIVRTAVSQRVFATVTHLLRGRHVLTQTTLGKLVERLKARGHVVWAESDMTCPMAWEDILSTEARRINAVDEMQSELPPAARTFEEQRAFAACDRIIVFSQWAFDNLPQAIQAKAVVVPSVSVPAADRPIHDDDDLLPIEFIFVGQVGFRKGAHILINAMRDAPLDQVTCHVFGGLRENFREYMERTGMTVPECVQLHGAGDWRAFVRNRPARYVAVLPSFVEGSPRFIYEAASMGIPAIVSPAARPSFFEHDQDALVLSDPGAEQLKQAAIRFVLEPSLWPRLSECAYASYQRQFDTASYGKRMAELLVENYG